MTTQTISTAEHYGRLATVAASFYVQTGNPAELDAVYVYAREAVRHAALTQCAIVLPLAEDADEDAEQQIKCPLCGEANDASDWQHYEWIGSHADVVSLEDGTLTFQGGVEVNYDDSKDAGMLCPSCFEVSDFPEDVTIDWA